MLTIQNDMSPRNGSCVAEVSSVRSLSSDDVSATKANRKKSCWARATDPAHRRGRRIQLLQMLVLPFIPILALIVQTANTLHDILIYRQEVSDIETQVTIATDLGKVVTRMQLERSEVAFFIYTNGNTLRSNLTQRFAITDQALHNMTTWPLVSVPRDESKTQTYDVVSKEAFQARLEDFRQKISSEESSITEVMAWYTSVNAAMLDHLTNQIKETDNSGVWRYLIAFKNLLRSIESLGIASVYGINYFGRGILVGDNYVSYVRHEALGRDLLNGSLTYVPSLKHFYVELTRTMTDYGRIKSRRDEILRNRKREPSVEDAIAYFDSMATYVDELRKLQRELRHMIRDYVNSTLQDASNKEVAGIAIVVLVLVVSPIIIILMRNAVATIQMYAANLAQKARELKREKRKSDTLLFQMLPPSVAQQLKQTQQVPAEYYEAVTVYFSDIVGFTEIAAENTPLEVVTFLNSIYKLFDARIECYDVYKVETIGDSYMVASGLPVRNGDKHVSEIATMALDLLAASSVFQVPKRPGERLQIRSGAHTGPVVAGIVGSKMPRYCLFGDTVNTASRMESTGEALRIHISLEMKKALDAVGGFKIVHRGLVDVKGKGLMDTYWLECKDGGIARAAELDLPTFFEDVRPVFMRRLREEAEGTRNTRNVDDLNDNDDNVNDDDDENDDYNTFNAVTMAAIVEEGEKLKVSPNASLPDVLDSLGEVTIKAGCFYVNSGSKKGRRVYLAQMILLPFIPIVALIAQSCHSMISTYPALRYISNTNEQISLTVELEKLLVAIQNERSESVLFLFSTGNNRTTLNETFRYTDAIIGQTDWKMCEEKFAKTMQTQLANLSKVRNKVIGVAKKENISSNDEMQDAVRWYIAVNYRLLEEISGRIGNSVTGNVSRLMIAYKYILRAIEHITISVVYEVQKYRVEDLPIRSLISYVKHDTLAREYIDATRYFAPELTTDFEENDPFDRLKEIYANASTISSNTNGISDYYYSAKAYVEILRKWENTVRDIIREELYREMISATGQQGIAIAILTLVLIISPIIIYLVRYATLTFQQFTDALISRTQELRREKIKSDLLLSQMLPPMVVKQLKQQRQVVAEYFDSVTICFSDIIGFTRISANSTAMEVLNMLNALYRLFDLRIKEYDVYKVETIGDSYMVVSGLPQRNGNRHADEIASMSLDLLDSIRTYDIPHRSGEKLEIRVGINTGPCVAGVIGTTMPRYCLVGDTINTASRMESTGEAMKIHISQSTNDALNLLGGYRTQLRGSMEVKGKGIMNTYWLIGKDNCTVENSNDQRLVPFPPEMKLQPEFFYLIE